MAKEKVDSFANMATINTIESAANTLTFKKLETGISTFEKVAWVVHKIEYYVDFLATIFDTTGDTLGVGLSVSNTRTTVLTPATFTDPAVIDLMILTRADFGAVATNHPWVVPITKDFSSMPGGGLIIPPVPLYGFAQGSGLAAATNTTVKLWYTMRELAESDYWQLVESRRVMTA